MFRRTRVIVSRATARASDQTGSLRTAARMATSSAHTAARSPAKYRSSSVSHAW
jgi:hypothetical protein